MSEDLPDEAYAIALALMPDFGPAKLRTLFAEASPPAAWASITGATSDARREMENQWRRHCDHGITVLLEDSALFPERLVRRQVAPPVLFCLGNPRTLSDKPTAAIIGTRSPTRYGIGVAAQLATELSAAGVSVVSGLALGIDGAAHEGACGAGAPPIGVVAGGLDEPYPMRHARLWERVSNAGVIVSEAPAGARAEKWRFPVRNRLMAALSDVVVVVESRHHSGSRHTVSAAVTLNIPVGAVPGSIRSATSEGTNELLSHCDFPVCSVTDILVCLARRGCNVTIPADAKPGRQPTAPVPASEQQLYAALTYEPTSLDELARLTGLDFAALCGGLERLAQAGFARDAGGWWERI
ncbi:MAG TPA: DNA-protecting protein DprA [Acidimicrobiales bacterium]|nr:DNA-protecting protein DprA [Acidimicrobiales bacterium]